MFVLSFTRLPAGSLVFGTEVWEKWVVLRGNTHHGVFLNVMSTGSQHLK